MTRRILTDEQINEAKKLHARDPKKWNKKTLAFKYGVGETTIYENVYATKKRVKDYVKTRTYCYFCNNPLEKHARCSECEILLHDDILKGEYTEDYCGADGINYTARAGNLCVKCYCAKNGIEFPKSEHRHTHEELSRLFGKSKETMAEIERTIAKKIIKNPKIVKKLKDLGYYEKYTASKIKHIEQILDDIPDEHAGDFKDMVREVLEEWRDNV